ADQPCLDDALGVGGRYDPAPVRAGGPDRPVAFGGEAFGLLAFVDGADELGGGGEGGVGGGDEGLVEQGTDLAAGEGVLQGLQQPVADHALSLGAEDV